jgi:hypothetical protein
MTTKPCHYNDTEDVELDLEVLEDINNGLRDDLELLHNKIHRLEETIKENRVKVEAMDSIGQALKREPDMGSSDVWETTINSINFEEVYGVEFNF